MSTITQTPTKQRSRWRRWNWVGPVGMLVTAAALVVLFCAMQLLGWREYTEILSGTMPATESQVLCGLLYAACYFLAVLAAPILAIGGLMYALAIRLFRAKA